jgi:hypothetical protein
MLTNPTFAATAAQNAIAFASGLSGCQMVALLDQGA